MIPEQPPTQDWEQEMCQAVKAGRDSGRRQSVVIVAEGAQDLAGNPITAHQIKTLLEDQLGEDARITILGHVQRGGAPSAFDRYLSTLLGQRRRRAAAHRRSRRRRPSWSGSAATGSSIPR